MDIACRTPEVYKLLPDLEYTLNDIVLFADSYDVLKRK